MMIQAERRSWRDAIYGTVKTNYLDIRKVSKTFLITIKIKNASDGCTLL